MKRRTTQQLRGDKRGRCEPSLSPTHLRGGRGASESQVLQVSQRAALLVENEREHRRAVLLPLTHERAHVGLPRDIEGHLSLGPSHVELHIGSSLLRSLGQVEADVAQREPQRDLLLLHGAGAQDGQSLRRHWHRHVHGRHTLVLHHGDC